VNILELLRKAQNPLNPAYPGKETQPMIFELTLDGKPIFMHELTDPQRAELLRQLFPGVDPAYRAAWDKLRSEMLEQ
jgi:hypothetical protein